MALERVPVAADAVWSERSRIPQGAKSEQQGRSEQLGRSAGEAEPVIRHTRYGNLHDGHSEQPDAVRDLHCRVDCPVHFVEDPPGEPASQDKGLWTKNGLRTI